MTVVTKLTITYLERQVKAGAEIIQLFESWGGALTPSQYARFCLPFSKQIITALKPKVPVIHFVGESSGLLPEVLTTDADVLGLTGAKTSHASLLQPAAKFELFKAISIRLSFTRVNTSYKVRSKKFSLQDAI